MVALIFAMMYYKVGIGYLYSITYYYSIVDILLSQYLQASEGLYLTVNIMSSFSKITPQFLGELRYSLSVTSLTRGGPRMVTRRYSHVKFKKFPWKYSFSRDVE